MNVTNSSKLSIRRVPEKVALRCIAYEISLAKCLSLVYETKRSFQNRIIKEETSL